MKYKDYIRKKKNQVEDRTNVTIGSLLSISVGMLIVVMPYLAAEEKEKFDLSKKLSIFFFLEVIIWLTIVSVTKADDCREKAVLSAILMVIFGLGPNTIEKGTIEAWNRLILWVLVAVLLVYIISKLIKKWDDD